MRGVRGRETVGLQPRTSKLLLEDSATKYNCPKLDPYQESEAVIGNVLQGSAATNQVVLHNAS